MNWTFEKVRRFYLYVGIFIGLGFHGSFHMFFEALLGLEDYLEFVEAHWFDRSIIWGLSGMAICIWVTWRARR